MDARPPPSRARSPGESARCLTSSLTAPRARGGTRTCEPRGAEGGRAQGAINAHLWDECTPLTCSRALRRGGGRGRARARPGTLAPRPERPKGFARGRLSPFRYRVTPPGPPTRMETRRELGRPGARVRAAPAGARLAQRRLPPSAPQTTAAAPSFRPTSPCPAPASRHALDWACGTHHEKGGGLAERCRHATLFTPTLSRPQF